MRWGRRRDAPCHSLAESLTIPQPFDLGTFCEGIAAQRGRPLLLLPLESPPGEDMPCGIWIGLDVADIVFYDASAPDILKIHIILHEVAHMLLGHVAPGMTAAADATSEEVDRVSERFQRLLTTACQAVDALDEPALPIAALARAEAARLRSLTASSTPLDDELGLSTDRIVSLLGRTKFADTQEADAETLATIILERASRNEARSTSHEAADVLIRLNDAFGHPVRDQ